ncbi:MAG: hypothetical protein DRP56_09945 [Planctomycetota bacterium]|nr:MAG: hypothetical protein DRP56_09945 [Planctomycetota bacterium]RKY13454.1 MAG: hypothetical protein DRP52_02740 [Planctomycetota bacterium]
MPYRHTPKNGFVLLLVLVIAILMLLYFLQINTLFAPGLPSESVGIEGRPWALAELLIPGGEDVKLPGRGKLKLDIPFTITAPVRRNDAERGEIVIAFNTDGRIRANWRCDYEQAGAIYCVDAPISGNIHTKRTYRDESGKDKGRLFFIAKGRYMKTPAGETDGGGEKGTCWLTGWIGPDRGIQGFITLTQNQQWAAVYAFEKSQ